MAVKEEKMSIRHGGIASYRINGCCFEGLEAFKMLVGFAPRFIQRLPTYAYFAMWRNV